MRIVNLCVINRKMSLTIIDPFYFIVRETPSPDGVSSLYLVKGREKQNYLWLYLSKLRLVDLGRLVGENIKNYHVKACIDKVSGKHTGIPNSKFLLGFAFFPVPGGFMGLQHHPADDIHVYHSATAESLGKCNRNCILTRP